MLVAVGGCGYPIRRNFAHDELLCDLPCSAQATTHSNLVVYLYFVAMWLGFLFGVVYCKQRASVCMS